MPRVVGIDPGTISLDLCGLADGEIFLDESIPTAEALSDPEFLPQLLTRYTPIDLVAGPSGYGLPLVSGRDLTERDVRLACLAKAGERGGIGGLGTLMRSLGRAPFPVVFTPGAIHLESVPTRRKLNRVDIGTADKVCAAVFAVHDLSVRLDAAPADISCIVLELGGAFTAALAVDRGRIVDGVGGTSGPIGLSGAGALDGEVAFLAGAITKEMLFGGGVRDVARDRAGSVERLATPETPAGEDAWQALLEGAAKTVNALRIAAPAATHVVVSGRVSQVPSVLQELTTRIHVVWPQAQVVRAGGTVAAAKHAAQGAALIADGLAGGTHRTLVDALGIRHCSGTVLDHVYVVSRAEALARLGL